MPDFVDETGAMPWMRGRANNLGAPILRLYLQAQEKPVLCDKSFCGHSSAVAEIFKRELSLQFLPIHGQKG